jgi:hypothetical protein
MFMNIVKALTKRFLSYARFTVMLFQFIYMLFPSRKVRLFNLDLHTSLIADISIGFKECDAPLISWNLSGNNRNFRKFFKIKDPVYPFSKKLWTDYTELDLIKFRNRYRFFLSRFDGFVVCFPPAFVEIFMDFGKPILVNIGTRYEAPYTRSQDRWDSLNQTLKSGVDSGQLSIIANNLADADYLTHFTGITPTVLPSLCEYTGIKWQDAQKANVLFCRNANLSHEVIKGSEGKIRSGKDYLGPNWSYKDLTELNSITVIPYNISTMSLFEYATAGIPVRVPSPSLLLELVLRYPDVLNEVSFLGAWGVNYADTDDELLNYTNIETLTWWLKRADFYQTDLMPNVQVCETFSELTSTFPILQDTSEYMAKIEYRNSRLSDDRRRVLVEFLQNIPKFEGSRSKLH